MTEFILTTSASHSIWGLQNQLADANILMDLIP